MPTKHMVLQANMGTVTKQHPKRRSEPDGESGGVRSVSGQAEQLRNCPTVLPLGSGGVAPPPPRFLDKRCSPKLLEEYLVESSDGSNRPQAPTMGDDDITRYRDAPPTQIRSEKGVLLARTCLNPVCQMHFGGGGAQTWAWYPSSDNTPPPRRQGHPGGGSRMGIQWSNIMRGQA